ncbi:DUF924 family protein [Sphingomonas sp.]|uniref:DUF924 family protein n=1 Tax=Sphingomonas sp. TaxID=28214 RepID=UPI0017A8ECB1|nr:DUF924 family protein [Sphingomonas sp.]MBA3510518.1 DUF924 domain-containing protein [Sphingomonas sp.]
MTKEGSEWRGELLRFWFGLEPERWWKADPELDEAIRRRFLKLWAIKRELPVASFLDDPLSALAAVILFDQFPRHLFRGHSEQFATDHLALAIARAAVGRGFDDQLEPRERSFLYMPFQHSEALADQRRSLALFTALGDDDLLGYARKHHEIIERFGRFPHRNATLGRAPRPAEAAAGDVVPW